MPRIAQPDHIDPAPPLACLVAGADGEHATHLVGLLERSARVGRVERVETEVVLRHALAVQHRDLVIIVLEAPDRGLPPCLLRYPGTRVLVVAPDGVSGTLSRWLQQGANDLVSPHDDDALAHAVGRLVDECALASAARRLDALVESQRRRIETLTARLEDRDGGAGIAAETTGRPGGDADPDPDPDPDRPDDPPGERHDPDSASRLPVRATTLAALDRLRARREDAPTTRLTALQVVLPAGSVHDALDRTLTDLAVCRAAEVMRRTLPGLLICGRTRRDTLLAVCEGGPEVFGHDAAARLAGRLGSLGELVERAGDVRVDALGGTVAAIATASLAERLEGRAHRALMAKAALGTVDERFPDPDDGIGGGVRRSRPATAAGTASAARPDTRYIGESGPGATLDDSLVPMLTQRSASGRFERPAAGA